MRSQTSVCFARSHPALCRDALLTTRICATTSFSSAPRCSSTDLNWSAPGLLLRIPARVRSALRKRLSDDPSLEAVRSPSWTPSFPHALSTASNHAQVGVHPDLFALAALPSQIDARVSTPAPSAPCAVRRIECARTSGGVTTRRSEWPPRLVCGLLSDAPVSRAFSRVSFSSRWPCLRRHLDVVRPPLPRDRPLCGPPSQSSSVVFLACASGAFSS